MHHKIFSLVKLSDIFLGTFLGMFFVMGSWISLPKGKVLIEESASRSEIDTIEICGQYIDIRNSDNKVFRVWKTCEGALTFYRTSEGKLEKVGSCGYLDYSPFQVTITGKKCSFSRWNLLR